MWLRGELGSAGLTDGFDDLIKLGLVPVLGEPK